MPNLKMLTSIVAFRDAIPDIANPRLRYVDWMRSLSIQDAANPRSDAYSLASGETRNLFNGQRSLTVAGNTVFSLSLVPNETINYRIRHTSGTAPGFRSIPAFSVVGFSVNWTVNADQTVTAVASGGSFVGISAGDTLWIPGSEEGVTSPFLLANQGFWLVMSVSALQLILRRTGDFNGITQAGVSITASDQIRAFSSTGVQIGDKIELLSGWASANLGTYVIVNVTSHYIDIQSTAKPLAAEASVSPNGVGQTIYTSGKRVVYLESDQEIVVRANGDAGSLYKVAPWIAGEDPGQFLLTGAIWSLTVVNAGQQSANIVVISVE
jgi:hypothetical protein